MGGGAPGVPEEGLFGPGSVSWRVHADPMMGVAGLRALFLQALHPLAMAGVAEHSAYREDPWGRLYRTAFFVGAVTYGTGPEVRDAVERVRRIHHRVRGTDGYTGLDYRADDPDLLAWVWSTETDSFLEVCRGAGLRLSTAEADRYVAEQARVGRLVGIPAHYPLPGSAAGLREWLAAARPGLAATPAARSALRFAFVPPVPAWVAWATPMRPAWLGVAGLAFALLPGWARRLYGLPGWPVTGLAAQVQARLLRAALLAVPAPLREGPHLRAARARWQAAGPGTAP